ncbi:MAG: hypothetical protein Q4A07_00520 [Coriobacteriales bacterium]|nr:hypothetical protein [Coriobacteriales bacterium]
MGKRVTETGTRTDLAIATFVLSASLMGAALPLPARMALAEEGTTVIEEERTGDDEAIAEAVSEEDVSADDALEAIPEVDTPADALVAELGGDASLPLEEDESDTVEEAQAEEPSVTYQAHVKNVGWMDWAANGETAGTEDGRSKSRR